MVKIPEYFPGNWEMMKFFDLSLVFPVLEGSFL
jgi:hypothetical protein